MIRKQKTRAWLLSLAAMVLLLSNYFVGWAEEPDPRILWVNKELNQIEGFAVHPNGNVFAYKSNMIYEIDGKDGKQISSFKSPIEIVTFNITDDGKYLVTGGAEIVKTDLETKESQKISKGDIVCCKPNSHEIAYKSWGNSDSSIVIYDMDTQARLYIKTEEAIRNIAFSPDGKYFATAGVIEKLNGDFITTLKLWDAQSLKLIKELERFDDEHYQIVECKFDSKSQILGFLGDMGLSLYSVSTQKKIINYPFNYEDIITSFEFFTSDSLFVQSKNTTILDISDNTKKLLFEFPRRAKILLSKQKDKLIVNSYIFVNEIGPMTALNVTKIISSVTNGLSHFQIIAEYSNKILEVKNIQNTENKLNFQIFDINGKLVHQLNAEPNGTELRIPIVLAKGTYLLNLTDGNKKYSSKFLVTE